MHDIDRTQAETWETFEFGPAEFGYESGEMYGETGYETEYSGEYEGEQETWGEAESYAGEYAYEGPLGETMELELTAELLEVSTEQELDRFLGKLIKGVGRAAGGLIRSPVGRALGGMLKGVAKRALPMVGGALGSMVAPGVGTMMGGALGSMAGNALGLELEGLSAEDQEFEMARQYVRLASEAAQHAATAPPTAPPQAIAQRAITAAAQQHAPGLVGVLQPGGGQNRANGSNGAMGKGGPGGMRPPQQGATPQRRSRRGVWVQQGPNIVLLGVYRRRS